MDIENLLCTAVVDYAPKGEHGEDALWMSCGKKDVHAYGVFDGCGGIGSRRYRVTETLESTGAQMGARMAAWTAEQWVDQTDFSSVTPAELGPSFHDAVLKQLQLLDGQYKSATTLVGSLVRTFPTTASIALVRQQEADRMEVITLTAGDSRVYILNPREGLVQVTQDELKGSPDPLQNLTASAPLANHISLERPFTMTVRRSVESLPYAVLACSDGMFGYVRSPMDFEKLVLDILCDAPAPYAFSLALQTRISEFTGDDATMEMGFYGWQDFEEVKASLKERRDYIDALCARLDSAPDEVKTVWEEYKQTAVRLGEEAV